MTQRPGTDDWVADAARLIRQWQQASAGHPAECRYCPLCQGLAVLRRVGPDLLEQVSTLTAELAETLRAEPVAPGEDGTTGGQRRRPAPKAEWIDITD